MNIQTINPATESVIETYPVFTQSAIDQQIEASHAAFHDWKQVSFQQRAELMFNLARYLRAQSKEYAQLMAMEMGKPLQMGQTEVEKCAWACEHYATHAETYLAAHEVKTDALLAKVCYQPQGIIFAVMPWNFPFWQVFRFAAPNLMAGNVGLLKHAPISTGTGYAISEAFLAAGFPKHVFNNMVLTNEQAALVIAHPHIRGLTFTGSEHTGMILAACAGSHLKKVVMELGGSDPYVVLRDADIDLAAKVIVAARLNNNGQTCIAAKRVIVVEEVADQLIEKMLTLIEHYRFGDPFDPNINLGPMARGDLRAALHQQVLDSVAKGAVLRLGGILPSERGFYYPPTVLTHVRPGMVAFDEEMFGPVFAIVVAAHETHAIELANQTRFGLGAAVFTRDIERGEQIATTALESGAATVNGAVSSDPRLPFGGTKHSGYGRELSREGILEFVNIKSVVVHKSERIEYSDASQR